MEGMRGLMESTRIYVEDVGVFMEGCRICCRGYVADATEAMHQVGVLVEGVLASPRRSC